MTILRLLRYGAWAAVAALAFVTVAVGSGWFVVDGPGARRVIATDRKSVV